MRLTDGLDREVVVARDPARFSVEVRLEETASEAARVIRLTRREARRLAALILFEAARLDRPRAGWGAGYDERGRRSA